MIIPAKPFWLPNIVVQARGEKNMKYISIHISFLSTRILLISGQLFSYHKLLSVGKKAEELFKIQKRICNVFSVGKIDFLRFALYSQMRLEISFNHCDYLVCKIFAETKLIKKSFFYLASEASSIHFSPINRWLFPFFQHWSQCWALKLTFLLYKYQRFSSFLSNVFSA